MKESLLWYIQVGLTYREKRASAGIFSSAEEILVDALKESVIVAVLGCNDERFRIVGKAQFEVLHCTGRGDGQPPYPETAEGLR